MTRVQSAQTINQDYTFWGMLIAILSSLFMFISPSFHLSLSFFVFMLFGISLLGMNSITSPKTQHLLFGGVVFYSIITPLLFFSYGIVVSSDVIDMSLLELCTWVFHAIMLYIVLVKYSYDEKDGKEIFTGTAIAMISSPILLLSELHGKNAWGFETHSMVLGYTVGGLLLFSILALFLKEEHECNLFHKKGVSLINTALSLCILVQLILVIVFSMNIILRY